jgi:hypothetical protein
MAKRKRLSVAIDLGSSLIKIVGVYDGAMSAVVMSPELIAVSRGSVDNGANNSLGMGSATATVDYCFVGVKDNYYAVGDLAQRLGALQRFKPLKTESAAYKILALVAILAQRFGLGNNFDLSIGCLLPPGELMDRELLKQQLVEFLPDFDAPQGRMNVNLVESCFHPEGAGILELYRDRYPASLKSSVGMLMAGHRNLTCYATKNGVITHFATCDLGFSNWVKEVIKRTSGYKLETLTEAIANYWFAQDATALKPILRRQDERAAAQELAHLIEVLESTNETYCNMVFDWLHEQLPTDITAVMISGGTADVLKDELVSYFDEKLPPHPELNGKAAIYYSNTGFNLPTLDVPPGCQSRMGDVYCLWQYLMSKPQPKLTKSRTKTTVEAK